MTAELTKLTAKAAGYQVTRTGLVVVEDGLAQVDWNPRESMSDALRLAADATIDLMWRVIDGALFVGAAHEETKMTTGWVLVEGKRTDAACNAITDCAIEVGRSML